jgi:predicted dienelactone hydrolase
VKIDSVRWFSAALLLIVGCDDAPPAATADAAVDVALGNDLGGDGGDLDGGDAPAALDAPDVRDVPPIDLGAGPIDPARWPVDQPGPFRVGFRSMMHTYTPPGTTTARTIKISFWYPTLVAQGAHPTYSLIFNDRDAWVDAPPAAPVHPRGYPVHVYSHGYQGFAGSTHFLMRYFASHGWLCVAPDHTGNTLTDTPAAPIPIQIRHWRSADVTASLDVLSALPAGDPLAGRADARAAVLSGHSFGSHTTWASAGATFDLDALRPSCTDATRCTAQDLAIFQRGLHDPRFVAVMPMAGSIDRSYFGPNGHRSVRVPVFSMSGTADPVGAEGQFNSTSGVDVTWIDVRGGCHQFFGLGHCPDIEDSLQGPIIGTYALAFARRHLLGDADPTLAAMLDGTRPVHERVAFRRHDAGL